EGAWPVFACEDAISAAQLAHAASGKGPSGREKGGRLDNDPGKTRYGCFLPDLTGLARNPSIASLPRGLYQDRRPTPQGGTNRRGRRVCWRRFHHEDTEEGRRRNSIINFVVPAKAGTQGGRLAVSLDPRFRGEDERIKSFSLPPCLRGEKPFAALRSHSCRPF